MSNRHNASKSTRCLWTSYLGASGGLISGTYDTTWNSKTKSLLNTPFYALFTSNRMKWTSPIPSATRHVFANGLETVRVKWHIFKVLRNGLLRCILYTCPNLWCSTCSKCYGMDCFGTYFTHVQTCDVTRVQSATEWTASVHTLHMSKPVM